MSSDAGHTVFTVGHSNVESARFLELLKLHQIQAIADVRSSPYSRYVPQFNREILQRTLKEQGVAYVYLGGELGAMRSEAECYVNEQPNVTLIARLPAFQRGLDRLCQGAARMRVAMMCAEKDPLQCHRCVLVSPRLRERGIEVQHILGDGRIETQEQAGERLVALLHLPEHELFRSRAEIVAEAYRLQAEKMGYQTTPPPDS
jgi:uncharacterized protein (DUF488 family)